MLGGWRWRGCRSAPSRSVAVAKGPPRPVAGQASPGSPASPYLAALAVQLLVRGWGNTWLSPYKASELLREPCSCPSASRLCSATVLKRQFLAPASHS